jgi:hypothetical protein
MAVNLTGIVGDLTNLIPSSNDLVQNVILGAGTSVVLAGLKSNSGQDALDPLHLFHKDGSSTVVGGKTISTAAFNALDAGGKAQVLAANYIIAG